MEEKYLSTFHNMDENDIQIIANQMKEYFGNENEELLNVIAQKLDTHPEIANSFSLHISKREWERLNVEKLKKLFASDEKLLEAYTNLQIELIKIAGDRLIASKLQQYEGERSVQAMQIKTALTEFAQMKINQMSNTFQESIRKFGLRRKEQLNEAKQYEEDAFYYDMLRKNLDQEAAFFFK